MGGYCLERSGESRCVKWMAQCGRREGRWHCRRCNVSCGRDSSVGVGVGGGGGGTVEASSSSQSRGRVGLMQGSAASSNNIQLPGVPQSSSSSSSTDVLRLRGGRGSPRPDESRVSTLEARLCFLGTRPNTEYWPNKSIGGRDVHTNTTMRWLGSVGKEQMLVVYQKSKGR